MAITRSAKTDPPSAAELELSLFGPGKGECEVLHLGQNEWVVVDSCLSRPSGRAVALDYMEQLEVDPARQVKMLVVTHWHDDHIRGAAQILRAATSAQFACSAALRCEDFFALVHAGDNTRLVEQTSGVREFAEIIEELQARAGGRLSAGPDVWAQEGMRLHVSAAGAAELHALSPSAQTITNTNRVVGALRSRHWRPNGPGAGHPPERGLRCDPRQDPNHALPSWRRPGTCGGRALRMARRPPIHSTPRCGRQRLQSGPPRGRQCGLRWHLDRPPCSAPVRGPYALCGGQAAPARYRGCSADQGTGACAYSTVQNLNFRPPRRQGVDRTIGEVAKNRRA